MSIEKIGLSFLGVGTVGTGLTGAAYFLLNKKNETDASKNNSIQQTSSSDDAGIPEGKKYTSYSFIPKDEQKYFLFSNENQPEKYDYFFLVNVFNNATSFGESWDDNYLSDTEEFDCDTQTSNGGSDKKTICQIFEIPQKDDSSPATDVKNIDCPTTIEGLKPIRITPTNDGKYKANFPKTFLFAIKFKNPEEIAEPKISDVMFVNKNKTPRKTTMLKLSMNNMANKKKCTIN